MESAHRVPRLPHEICDMILDYLQDDDESLAACALTCRAWLPRSRTHIWRIVVISDGVLCVRLAQILDSSPHLSLLVHELVLQEGSDLTEGFFDEDEAPLWMNYGIPRICGKFPALQSLELTKMRWEWCSPVAIEALLALVAPVNQLSVARSCFQNEDQLCDLLEACAGLARLSIYGTDCDDDETSRPSSARLPIPLKTMHLASLHVEVIDWLFQWRHELRIQRLSILDIAEGVTGAVAALLQNVGDALQHLEIAFGTDGLTGADFQDILEDHFSLRWNTRLRSLYIDSAVMDSCRWLPTLLAQITSTELFEITLDLPIDILRDSADAPSTGLPVAPDWAHVDRMLTGDKFARLKLVTIMSLESDSMRASWMDCLQTRLPRVFAKGLLNVVSLAY